MTRPNIPGIHHITAISASAARTLTFYETILGLRLVKQTVNFDDPATYHLYFGNSLGAPGTILTFFPWANLPQGRPGARMVTAVAFAVSRDAIKFWKQRLTDARIRLETLERFGEPVLRFADPDGLPLELIGISNPQPAEPWPASTLSQDAAITGFHGATATAKTLEPVAAMLTQVMGMTELCHEQNRYRYAMSDPVAPGHFYDVVFDPRVHSGRSGHGTVHHIAFRTENDSTQIQWQTILQQSGLAVTDVRDRLYFHSIYFHSPDGVLFEIATDPPGFAVDESPATLGTSLKLPAQYEAMRETIEKRLPPLRPDQIAHAFRDAAGAHDDGTTLVTLHGSGGTEHDLLEIAANVDPSAAVISLRGRTTENGMARFFKRVANNVFDEQDVVERANELADFLVTTAPRYSRDTRLFTAMGYSNGANMAAAVILLHPKIFNRAVLIRPMLPLKNPTMPDLQGKKILILRGARDRIIPAESTDLLVETFRSAGAELTVLTTDSGHEITSEDLDAITAWLAKQPASGSEFSAEAHLEEDMGK